MLCSFFSNTYGVEPHTVDLTLAELFDALAQTASTPLERSRKGEGTCFVPAEFAPAYRRAENVVRRFAFTGDVDDVGSPTMEEMSVRLSARGLAHILHATTKSRRGHHRYRVIVEYAEPLDAATSKAASASIAASLGGCFDSKTFDAGRLSILPYAWTGSPEAWPEPWIEDDAHHGLIHVEGNPIDARAMMVAFPPPPPPAPPRESDRPLLQVDGLDDLDRSPLVSPAMIETYQSSPEGGRFYGFLCSAAARAVRKGLDADPCALGLGIVQGGDPGWRRRRDGDLDPWRRGGDRLFDRSDGGDRPVEGIETLEGDVGAIHGEGDEAASGQDAEGLEAELDPHRAKGADVSLCEGGIETAGEAHSASVMEIVTVTPPLRLTLWDWLDPSMKPSITGAAISIASPSIGGARSMGLSARLIVPVPSAVQGAVTLWR